MKKDIISKIESLLEKGCSIRSISEELGISRHEIFKEFPELYKSSMSEENEKCLIFDYLKGKLKIEELEE